MIRWISSCFEFHGIPRQIDTLADLQDGIVLGLLAQHLAGESVPLKTNMKENQQKMVTVGRIQTVLDYIAQQGVRVTCSPTGTSPLLSKVSI